jgi:hypothetical protein
MSKEEITIEESVEIEDAIEEPTEIEDALEETTEIEDALEEPTEPALSIKFEDEEVQEEPNEAPEWVKELRTKHREAQQENKKLKKELEALQSPAATTLGAKPTLEDCDYEDTVYEQKLAAWFDQKRLVEEQKAAEEKAQKDQEKEWQKVLNTYEEKKIQLGAKDYDEAEEAVKEFFSVQQQGIMLEGADNPANLVYALGKYPKKAQELAAITNPIQFAVAIAKLEAKLTVTQRKPAVTPEQSVTGKGHTPANSEAQLNRLREEAARTGDHSKVVKYKRQLRQK